ncbi:LysR family transcriptional regulator [Candidatus Symbiopectobacterium sp. NZEC127]|uniref:LysR family transcriptional regulator n=1 Tax=Candidatus Symbiopectobacterium sp. NZEC127 TaxID=2820472 RepID=UPI002227B988|nr:LysR family transcriptional regulator [Candidatus Symbiopectobacterium sp. NZEC127]MCW2485010.1 LysR family transcriptional regulator [Candidatus Symbiopectobacterium sp. NZEC127]
MAQFNLDQLVTYKLVIQRGSFTSAATALGISQPAVSLQIRQLEQALHVRLIERTGRGVRPTAAGLALLDHCDHIENAVNAALHAVAQHQQDISGTVMLGTGATACIHLLPTLLCQLQKAYPRLSIGVRTGNTQHIVRAVEENSIDLGLVTLPVSGRSLSVTPVIKDEFVAIVQADSTGDIRTLTPKVFAEQPLIAFETGSHTRQLIDDWLHAEGKTTNPIMALGSIEAIKRMVSAGLGYSIVPSMSVMTPADKAGLSVYPLEPRLHRTLGIVMRQDKVINRSMAKVLEHIHTLADSEVTPF